MKFNLESIFVYLRKNKYVFLVVFIMFIFLFHFRTVREGLTGSSDYNYLAPPPSNNKWNDNIWNAFVKKWNSIFCPTNTNGPNCLKLPVDNGISNFYYKNATQPEIQYYIKNGIFPYNKYVTNYASKNPRIFNGYKDHLGNDVNISYFQKAMPNRSFYQRFMSFAEAKMNPLPQSYKVFSGNSNAGSNANSTTFSCKYAPISGTKPTLSQVADASKISPLSSNNNNNKKQYQLYTPNNDIHDCITLCKK